MTGGGLQVVSSTDDEDQMRWLGVPRVTGPPWSKNLLVTSGFLGLTSVWTIEMSQASPYLIELGLSKSYMSLVFVAGPLSGLIMQPLIGIMADRCQSSWGRRRPFIIAGIVLTVVAMLLLGWAKELASLLLGEGNHKILSIILAVFSVFLIDFAVNAIQAADRALLVDTLPPIEQEAGNAWAGRLSGFGSVAGFWIGNINLHESLPFFGKTQLQALSILTSIILISTHALTLATTHERVLLSSPFPPPSFLSNFRSIAHTTRTLPPDIRTLCFVQFFAWIGWFPVLFFTSVWVSDLYTANALRLDDATEASPSTLYDEATRAGSRALFFNALVAFGTAVLLPFLVEAEGDREKSNLRHPLGTERQAWKRWIRLPIRGLSLPLVWCVSLGIFAALMASTIFVESVWAANLVIGLTGFCWAIANWAPFSILGELILQDTSPSTSEAVPLQTRHPHHLSSSSRTDSTSHLASRRLSGDEGEGDQESHFLLGSAEDDAEEEDEETKESNRQRKALADCEPTDVAASSKTHSGRSSFSDSESSVIIVGNTPPVTSYASSPLRSPSLDHARRAPLNPHHTASSGVSSSSSTHPAFSLEPPSSPPLRLSLEESPVSAEASPSSTASQAGAILGIHNLFIVLPQFLVTFLSSIIFYLLEPTKTVTEHGSVSHPTVGAIPPKVGTNGTAIASLAGQDSSSGYGNGTLGILEEVLGERNSDERLATGWQSSLGSVRTWDPPSSVATEAHDFSRRLFQGTRDIEEMDGSSLAVGTISSQPPDAVGFIFRFGGVSAAVACFLCYRMMRGMEAKQRMAR